MKRILAMSVFAVMFCWATGASAVGLTALDRVHVLMPKAKVVSLLGSADEKMTLANGLKVEVYHIASAPPLMHSGCIYNKEGLLMGQSFVFHGRLGGSMIERLKKHGFTAMHNDPGIKGSDLRLTGFDDDSGRPLVAVIHETETMTTITTFEKGFYEVTAR